MSKALVDGFFKQTIIIIHWKSLVEICWARETSRAIVGQQIETAEL